MYTAIKGIFENRQVIFEEPPPTTHRMSVVVIFAEHVRNGSLRETSAKQS